MSDEETKEPANIHEELALEAYAEIDREAEAIVKFLQDRLVSLKNYERGFVETLDPSRVFWGQLNWAEQMARRLGYTNI